MANRLKRRLAVLEAASSSSDDDFDSSSEEQSIAERPIQSLDDLPSDDSVSLASDNDHQNQEQEEEDDDDDGNESSSSDDDEGNDDNEETKDDVDEENETLEDRVQRTRDMGLSQRARADARNRKSQALLVASTRLKVGGGTPTTTQKHTSSKSIQKPSKHAPTEASSKRADFFRRGAPQLNSSGVGVEIGAHRYKPRDPRMSSMSGHLDTQHFDRNFAFLQELRDNEIAAMKKKIAARRAGGRKGQKLRRTLGITQQGSLEEDQAELTRLVQEKAGYERSQVEVAAKQAVKKNIRDEVAEGKRGVYFLKRREIKKLHLEAKFVELRKRGGDKAVDKVVEKRRKKNKSKDTGYMAKDS